MHLRKFAVFVHRNKLSYEKVQNKQETVLRTRGTMFKFKVGHNLVQQFTSRLCVLLTEGTTSWGGHLQAQIHKDGLVQEKVYNLGRVCRVHSCKHGDEDGQLGRGQASWIGRDKYTTG